MNAAQKEQLFELIKEHGSIATFKPLLRSKKESPGDRSILVSGTYDELLRQLRLAHDGNRISLDELRGLLARCEENGGQHILYYIPPSAAAGQRLADVARVQDILFDGKTAAELGLPRIYLNPIGAKWADFRTEARKGTNYTTWTAKMYSGVERTELVSTSEEPAPNEGQGVRYIIRKFRRYPSREVVVLKWHSLGDGLLEIRLPCHKSVSFKTLNTDRTALLETLNQVVAPGSLRPMNLTASLSKLVAKAEDNHTEYYVNNVGGPDHSDGRIDIKPGDDADDILEDDIRREVLKNLSSCDRAVVNWTFPEQVPNMPEHLRVQFNCYFTNEIRIGAHTSPEALEYVTRRLFELQA